MNAEPEQDWARMCHMMAHRYDSLCINIMRKIANGGSIYEVLETVGDSMNDCDRLDDESLALFSKAKARLRANR